MQMADIHGGDGKYEGHRGYHFWPTDISSAEEVEIIPLPKLSTAMGVSMVFGE